MQKLSSLQEWLGKDAEPSKRKVVQGIKIALLICFFIGLFWMIPIADVLLVIRSTNLFLFFIGVFLGLPKIYFNSVMLGLLTRKQGLIISFNRLFAVNMMVKFYMQFLPGAIIGSGIRWAKISPSGKSAESFAAVAFNRIAEIFLIIITGGFWFLMGISQESFNLIILLIFLFGIVFVWLIYVKISIFLAAWFEKQPNINTQYSSLKIVWGYIGKIVKTLSVYTEFSVKELIVLITIGIVSNLIGLASYIFIARSIGISISFFDLGWTQSIILLAAYSPLSIAGGLGIREVSLVVLLALFGVSAENALAFSILLFLRGIILSSIGGLFELGDIIRVKRAV